MKKRTFRVTFDLVFEDSDGCCEDEIKELNVDTLSSQIDTAFEVASYDFFGESLCMSGLLTPTVKEISEV